MLQSFSAGLKACSTQKPNNRSCILVRVRMRAAQIEEPKQMMMGIQTKCVSFMAQMAFAAGIVQAQSAALTPEAKTIYLKCGAVWDGRSDQLQRNVVIAVSGQKISSMPTAVALGQG